MEVEEFLAHLAKFQAVSCKRLRCQAGPGESCKNRSGKTRTPHSARKRAYHDQVCEVQCRCECGIV